MDKVIATPNKEINWNRILLEKSLKTALDCSALHVYPRLKVHGTPAFRVAQSQKPTTR